MDELYLTERINGLERTVAKMGDKILQLERLVAYKNNQHQVNEAHQDYRNRNNIDLQWELWCRIYGRDMETKLLNVGEAKEFAKYYANQVK